MRRIVKPLFTALLCVLATACISHHTERVADVKPIGWSPADTVWVPYPNADTLSQRDLYVILRYNSSLRDEKIDIDVHTMRPDSVVYSERVTLNIQTYGDLRQDHYEAVIPYRRHNVMDQSGDYVFGFSPAATYGGITAVGIDTL